MRLILQICIRQPRYVRSHTICQYMAYYRGCTYRAAQKNEKKRKNPKEKYLPAIPITRAAKIDYVYPQLSSNGFNLCDNVQRNFPASTCVDERGVSSETRQ